MHHRMKIPALLLALAGAFGLSAQKPDSVETFYVFKSLYDSTGVTAKVSLNLPALQRISLNEANFPTVTLPRSVFRKTLDIGNRNSRLASRLDSEIQIMRQRDTLQTREIDLLNNLLKIHQEQLTACEQHNGFLNESIVTLNGQVNSSLELAKEARKNSLGKKTWGILIGGGIGLGLGMLLGVIAAK